MVLCKPTWVHMERKVWPRVSIYISIQLLKYAIIIYLIFFHVFKIIFNIINKVSEELLIMYKDTI